MGDFKMRYSIFTLFIFTILGCVSKDRQLTKPEKKILYSYSNSYVFNSFNKKELELYFGEDIAKNLLIEPNEHQYLMTIKNIGFDTLFVPIRSPSGIPLYDLSLVEYFNNITDTVKTNNYIPFNGSDEMLQIVKGSERYFITNLPVRENIAKIHYQFYTDSNKKNEITEYVYIKRDEGKFIQLEK
jgi:hypothetical protein